MSSKKIAAIISNRDDISMREAEQVVDECMEELKYEIECGGTLDALEDIVADYLGLEPDYLDILLNELI